MSASAPLPPEQEAQAQELLLRLREKSEDKLLALARLLVSKEDHELFGDTELQAREIVHRIGATAIQTHLEQKKRLPGIRSRVPQVWTMRKVSGIPE